MKTLKTKWTGIRPMLVNNGAAADPLNPQVRNIKKIVSKGQSKMTDDDHAVVQKMKFMLALYVGENGKPVVPSDNIERCIQLGGQKSKAGKLIQAATFLEETEVPVEFDGPKSPEAMYDKGFYLKKGVVIGRQRIIGIRPMFPVGWSLTFSINFDESVVDPETIEKAMHDAGSLIGCCDWRPKFGRFLVEML